MTNIVALQQGAIVSLNQPIEDVYGGLIASKHSSTTQDTYRKGLKYFASFLLTAVIVKGEKVCLTEVQVKTVLMEFIKFDKKTANAYLGSYQSKLIELNYAPNSINIKIASVKAFVRYAFDFEQCSYQLDKVKSLTPDTYRDTKGTTPANIKEVLNIPDTLTVKGKRDYAILRLLWDNALRRGEISSLSIADFNYDHLTLKIKGKGRLSKEIIYLSPKTASAIQQWLDCLGVSDSKTDKLTAKISDNDSDSLTDTPLFISLDNRSLGSRLTGRSIDRLVKKYSGEVVEGKLLSPHKVRHSSITAVLDASNGNVRLAQKLSRHKNLDVLTRYDDNRIALQKEAVNLLADLV